MNFPFYIARRYLFSRKSHNIINIISLISAIGVMIVTAALVIVLSVFNGFARLSESLFNSFNPDMTITLKKGKTFGPAQMDIRRLKQIKGVKYGDFMDVSDEVVEKEKKKVYRYTRDLVRELKKEGYFLLAISQSPKGTLDKFCKTLGFDKVYGRIYELGPEDRFTGVVVDEHLISNKANIVKRAVLKENLSLKNSIGIGDTEGDIPMLEMVARPICFNPNMKLYRQAKMNKWKVVVERKDVIYEL